MLTQERLKELFHYDPLTGLFTRLVKTGRKAKIGSIAGCLDKSKGYISIRINNKDYYAHRLAVLYMTGKFPECQVDHEDTIKHHNWWDNLRVCNNSQNRENQTKARLDNKSSGLLGVTASNHNTGFFVAQIGVKGKHKYLGTYKTKEEAHQVYLDAKRNLHEFNTL